MARKKNKKVDDVPVNENIMKLMTSAIIKRREEELAKKLELEHKIINDLIPSIQSSAVGFIDAGNAMNGLSEMLRIGIETLAKKTKIKDLGLLEHLEAYDKADPVKASKFAEQKSILEAISEWTVDEAMFSISWMNLKLNSYTERKLLAVTTREFTDNLLENIKNIQNVQETKEQISGVASPYQGPSDDQAAPEDKGA